MTGQPLDIKLMNFTTNTLLWLWFAVLAAGCLWWLLHRPWFAIANIAVDGEVMHNDVMTLRASIAPRLTGNFFTLDLATAQQAFEAVPWVRHAVVRREFPNRLRVRLQEHRAVAVWGSQSNSQLINNFGEIFAARPADLERTGLPRLDGLPHQASQVLATYNLLKPLLATLQLDIEHLALNALGSWQLELNNGAQVELGRGSPKDVAARTQRFVQTVLQVSSRYGRQPDALLSADLRYSDGYALRLKGVATTADTEDTTNKTARPQDRAQ